MLYTIMIYMHTMRQCPSSADRIPVASITSFEGNEAPVYLRQTYSQSLHVWGRIPYAHLSSITYMQELVVSGYTIYFKHTRHSRGN
jgi:hypothetical protein